MFRFAVLVLSLGVLCVAALPASAQLLSERAATQCGDCDSWGAVAEWLLPAQDPPSVEATSLVSISACGGHELITTDEVYYVGPSGGPGVSLANKAICGAETFGVTAHGTLSPQTTQTCTLYQWTIDHTQDLNHANFDDLEPGTLLQAWDERAGHKQLVADDVSGTPHYVTFTTTAFSSIVSDNFLEDGLTDLDTEIGDDERPFYVFLGTNDDDDEGGELPGL